MGKICMVDTFVPEPLFSLYYSTPDKVEKVINACMINAKVINACSHLAIKRQKSSIFRHP